MNVTKDPTPMINNNQSRFQILRNPEKTAKFENNFDTPLVSKHYIKYIVSLIMSVYFTFIIQNTYIHTHIHTKQLLGTL